MEASPAKIAAPEDAQHTAPAIDRWITFPAPGLAPHGAAKVVSIQRALENGDRSKLLARRLLTAACKAPICLHPVDLPGGSAGLSGWRRFCEWLRDAAARERINLNGLATSVHSHHLPLADFHAITDSFFGAGQRFVFLDSLQMQSHCDDRVATVAARNWTYLWRQRTAPRPVLPVYGGLVRSTCPLLADEAAVATLPVTGLQVPAHTAWLPIQLDLAGLADPHGYLDRSVLKRVIRAALQEADRRIDQSCWPGRRRQTDARLNRRIAMIVSGIGDLVVRRGEDPGAFSCLRSMHDLIGEIRAELRAVTAQLARQFGEVPSLSRACPSGNWFEGSHHRAWQAEFDKARLSAAVRHRNLLALSPYSVLPAVDPPTPRFMDLLPLLGLADAWAFAGGSRLASWNVTQFQYFHLRARAIIQAAQGASRIAAGV
ncbi:MAG: hypothetical protein KJO55_02720 [Gammaproteobacteria bacterium]|nr:hypothetical protein [Gammaproteobacteria bacterium]